jgi:hypothetical protein
MRKTGNRKGILSGLAILAVTGIFTGCGGNDPLPPKTRISHVYVMGDSLSDWEPLMASNSPLRTLETRATPSCGRKLLPMTLA